MKPLPKEFQFKCDEHSREQCKVLGIDIEKKYGSVPIGWYIYVLENNINIGDLKFNLDIPLISLADYLEPTIDYLKTSTKMFENYTREITGVNRESDLIVELTGKYVAVMCNKIAIDNVNEKDYIIGCINLAEETVKQLKERGYLK